MVETCQTVLDLLQSVENVLQLLNFLRGEGDAFAHSRVVFIPRTKVVFGFVSVPGNEVELFRPAASGVAVVENRESFDNIVFNFCHDDSSK